MAESQSLYFTCDMTSTGLSNTIPVVPNLELEMAECTAGLGQSAGPEGAELRAHNTDDEFQVLKAEHVSLQHEFTRVQNELKNLQSNKQSEQEEQLRVADLQGKLEDVTSELEEFEMQLMTPSQITLLRMQIQQEMEERVRERFFRQEQEAEMCRAELKTMRYDFTILQSKYDHQSKEHARILEVRNIYHEAEINRLKKDREDLVAHYEESDTVFMQEQMLLTEKALLKVRLEGLQAEVAELQAQKVICAHQAQSVQRISDSKLTESLVQLKTVEAERLWLRQHVERLENELHLSQEQSSLETEKLHKAECEVSCLCFQLDSLKHSHGMEMDTVKLNCVRVKGEMERERDALQSHIDGLQKEVVDVREALEWLKGVQVHTQSEMEGKMQCAREEELRKFDALLEEKVKLEHCLVEHQRALQAASDTQQSQECARTALHNLRRQFQQQSSQAEKQEAAFADLQQQNRVLGVELERLSCSESDLKETNQRLQQASETMKEELRAAKAQAEKSQNEAERLVEQCQANWSLEEQLKQREAELQQRKKKKLMRSKERQHRHETELLEARIVELELEAALYKKQVDGQCNARRRLKKAQQRLDEFYQLQLCSQGSMPTSTD